MFPIQIALTHALALYSAIFGIIIFLIWLYTGIAARRTHRSLEKQNLWRCSFCGYVYLDEGSWELSKCPRCESYNSADDKHARYTKLKGSKKEKAKKDDSQQMVKRNPSRHKRPGQKRRGPRRRSR